MFRFLFVGSARDGTKLFRKGYYKSSWLKARNNRPQRWLCRRHHWVADKGAGGEVGEGWCGEGVNAARGC